MPYVGEPYKTARIVRQILATQYSSASDGVPGNDDSGSMGLGMRFTASGSIPMPAKMYT